MLPNKDKFATLIFVYGLYRGAKKKNKKIHAEYCYKRALEINPKDSMTWNNLGILLDAQDNEKKSIACLVKTVQINPNDASSWFNLGTIYAKYDKYQKAVIVLKNGLEYNSDNIDLWTSLMYVYQILEKYDEAAKCFSKIKEIEKKGIKKQFFGTLKDISGIFSLMICNTRK